jgi:hypothetical protein
VTFPVEITKTRRAIVVVEREDHPRDRRRFLIADQYDLPADIFHTEYPSAGETHLPRVLGLFQGWRLVSMLELSP